MPHKEVKTAIWTEAETGGNSIFGEWQTRKLIGKKEGYLEWQGPTDAWRMGSCHSSNVVSKLTIKFSW